MDEETREKIATGMYLSDRCQFCGDFGEKVEPYLCPSCKEGILKLGYRKVPKHEGQGMKPRGRTKVDKRGGSGKVMR